MDPGQEPGWLYWEVQGAGRGTSDRRGDPGAPVQSWALAAGGPSRSRTCLDRGLGSRLGSRGRVSAECCRLRCPLPPNPALSDPAGSCPARRSAPRGATGPRAPRPAPRPGPYVTDFEFPDRGTRELGRRLCLPEWPSRCRPGLGLGDLCLWSPSVPGSLLAPADSLCLSSLFSVCPSLSLSLSLPSVLPQEFCGPHRHYFADPTSLR